MRQRRWKVIRRKYRRGIDVSCAIAERGPPPSCWSGWSFASTAASKRGYALIRQEQRQEEKRLPWSRGCVKRNLQHHETRQLLGVPKQWALWLCSVKMRHTEPTRGERAAVDFLRGFYGLCPIVSASRWTYSLNKFSICTLDTCKRVWCLTTYICHVTSILRNFHGHAACVGVGCGQYPFRPPTLPCAHHPLVPYHTTSGTTNHSLLVVSLD